QKALAWLQDAQNTDGSFSNPYTGENADSTGLAAQALRAADDATDADKAAAFLRSLQIGCTGPADEVGAITADANGFSDSTSAAYATADAILGLGGPGLWQLSTDGADPDAPTLVCTQTSSAGGPSSSATGPTLPKTGSSLTPLIVTGAAVVAVGVLLVV